MHEGINAGQESDMQNNRLARCAPANGKSLDVEGQHRQGDAEADHHDEQAGEQHEQVFLHFVNSVFLAHILT